jgi:hypothetical protein
MLSPAKIAAAFQTQLHLYKEAIFFRKELNENKIQAPSSNCCEKYELAENQFMDFNCLMYTFNLAKIHNIDGEKASG